MEFYGSFRWSEWLNVFYSISTYRVPTWITPVVLLMFASALGICEFLGHLCCIGVGYICMNFPPTSVIPSADVLQMDLAI